ncbi:MAG: EscU/YscU/HrcU family type III secretion system export apparatus switch protein, partial [Paracraurococcus sp.]
MAEGQDAEDRSEAPTQRRLDKAREQGQVPVSREAATVAALLAATLAGVLTLPAAGLAWLRALQALLEAPAPDAAAALGLLRAGAHLALPVIAAAAVATILGHLAQSGPLLRPEAVLPDLGRLNPGKGLQKIIGKEAWFELPRT